MENSIVFADSPLADYLENSGVSSWGIEPNSQKNVIEIDSDSLNDYNNYNNSYNKKNKNINTKGIFKKFASNEYNDSFLNLFNSICYSSISQNQVTDFLDKFRYNLVTSQLLNECVQFSSISERMPKDTEKLIKDNDNFYYYYIHENFNELKSFSFLIITHSSCVIIITILLSWACTQLKLLSIDAQRKTSSIATLIFTVSLSLLFHFQSRRQALKFSYKQVLSSSIKFITVSQSFDYVICKALIMIQEVEILSRGYKLGSSDQLPPISRIELNKNNNNNNTSVRHCKHLRIALRSAFNLAIPRFLTIINSLKSFCNSIEVDKYYDIYNVSSESIINIADLNSSSLNFDNIPPFHDIDNDDINGSNYKNLSDSDSNNDKNSKTRKESENENENNNGNKNKNKNDNKNDKNLDDLSLKALKLLFHKFHLIRRVLICHLLSIDATGVYNNDISIWRSVFNDLQSLSNLIKSLVASFSSAYTIDEDIYKYVNDLKKQRLIKRRNACLSNNPSNNSNNNNLDQSNSLRSSVFLPNTMQWKVHARALNNLSASLRTIEAKMQIMRDEAVRSLELDNDKDDNKNSKELIKLYESIGIDVQSLLKEWQNGKQKIENVLLGKKSTQNYIDDILNSPSKDLNYMDSDNDEFKQQNQVTDSKNNQDELDLSHQRRISNVPSLVYDPQTPSVDDNESCIVDNTGVSKQEFEASWNTIRDFVLKPDSPIDYSRSPPPSASRNTHSRKRSGIDMGIGIGISSPSGSIVRPRRPFKVTSDDFSDSFTSDYNRNSIYSLDEDTGISKNDMVAELKDVLLHRKE